VEIKKAPVSLWLPVPKASDRDYRRRNERCSNASLDPNEPVPAMPTPDNLFKKLLGLPVNAALVLPLGISAQDAKRAAKKVIEHYDPRRRFVIGEHVVRPRPAETLRHVRIERLPDA
jgi:hypothetical protein